MKVLTEPAPPMVERYEFGAFQLNVACRQLLKDGMPVVVTPKVFDTLVFLIRHADRVVSKEELTGRLWPDSFVSEGSLTQNISLLRVALSDRSDHPQFIATVARRGYRFVAAVTHVPAAAPVEADASTAKVQGIREVSIVKRSATSPFRSWAWRTSAVGAVSLAIGIVVGSGLGRDPNEDRSVVDTPLQFTLTPPDGLTMTEAGVMSPAGQHVAFVARKDDSGQTTIWLRPLASTEYRVIAGTEGASGASWAPNSRAIGFFSGGNLKALDLADHSLQTLAAIGPPPASASWGAGGTILFAGRTTGLFAVPAQGGPATEVTVLDLEHESAHQWPQFLPDGKRFLFHVASDDPQVAGTYVGSLGSRDRTRVFPGSGVYAAPGYLLHTRGQALAAQAFDLVTLRLTGEALTVIANLSAGQPAPAPTVVSASGTVSLALSTGGNARQLTWFSATGQTLGTITTPIALRSPALLMGDKYVLATAGGQDRSGLWLVDLETGAANRVATSGSTPTPSPDGRRFAFVLSKASAATDIYVKSLDGSGQEELVLKTPEFKYLDHWSPDGRYVTYVTRTRNNYDVWLLPTFGDRKPLPFLHTAYNELLTQVSPNGRWAAYTSDKSGTWEVYVRRFPDGNQEHAVSVAGGWEPHWNREGTTLFYLAASRWLMAVDVTPGNEWRSGKPQPLFQTFISEGPGMARSQYAVAADGQRFLINTPSRNNIREPTTVMVNWTALIGR